MKLKSTKGLEEFKREFQKNKKFSLLAKITVYFLGGYTWVMFMVYIAMLFPAFSITMVVWKVGIGVFFLVLFFLIWIVSRIRGIQYFGLTKDKIKKKLEKDVQEWKHELHYLDSAQKSLSKEEYSKYYLVKQSDSMSVEYEHIPGKVHMYQENISITEDKIRYLDDQVKPNQLKILDWEWVKAI